MVLSKMKELQWKFIEGLERMQKLQPVTDYGSSEGFVGKN